MLVFPVHSLDSNKLPMGSRAVLEVSKKTYGGIPNIHGVMAGSPALLEAYQALNKIFNKSSLTNTERNIVWLEINYFNNCHYCMAAHSAIAKMSGVNADDIEALRTGQPLSKDKHQVLREFTGHMLAEKGWATKEQLRAMEAVGYTSQTVLDVILAIGMKTLSNYANHVADTPVDEGFKEHAWQAPK